MVRQKNNENIISDHSWTEKKSHKEVMEMAGYIRSLLKTIRKRQNTIFWAYKQSFFVWLVGFLASQSTTGIYSRQVPRLTFDNFMCCHTRDSWETMASVSAGNIILIVTELMGLKKQILSGKICGTKSRGRQRIKYTDSLINFVTRKESPKEELIRRTDGRERIGFGRP